MDIERERAEFERAVRQHFEHSEFSFSRAPDGYFNAVGNRARSDLREYAPVSMLWSIWQAARAERAEAAKPIPSNPGELDRAEAAQGDSYNDLWNALQRIDTAVCGLPTFEVRHEGGLDAAMQNILYAIKALAERAEAAQRVPQGWKLVPVGPTQDMLIAGSNAASGFGSPLTRTKRAYHAMLAAAPEPPQGERP